MKDQAKTKEQLINELVDLRQRVKERTRELRKTNNDLQAEMKEHKRKEAASIQTEEIFNKLFNTIPDAIMIFDSDTRRFIDVNESALQMYGYTRDEFLKLNQSDISAEHEASDLSIEETLAGKRGWVPVRYHRKKDGTIFPVEISDSTFPLGERQVLCGVIRDITKRKQAEEKVNQQNRFLNTVIESLSHPFVVINIEDYTIKLTNSAAATGNISETATCYSIMHRRNKPCRGQEGTCTLEEVKKSKKPITVEHLHYSEDGSLRNIEIHGFPVFDEEGNLVQIIEYSLDITERKQLEDALRESERRLKEAQRIGEIGDWEFDVETQQIDWSEQVYRLFARDPAQGPPTYKENLAYYYPEDSKRLQDQVNMAIEGNVAADTDYLLRMPSGKSVWHRGTIRTKKDENGRVVKLYGTVQDITDRKEAAEKIRKYQQDLETIFNSVPAAIWYKDRENRIVWVNKAGANSVGRKVEEIEGKPVEELFPSGDAEHYYQDDLEVMSSGKPKLNIIEEMQTSSGERKWVRTDKVPYIDSQGNITGVIAFARDITARKHAEEQVVSLAKFPSENPNPVLRVSREGSILYANDASKLLFDDWCSKISQLVPAHWNKFITESLKSGQSRIEEIKSGDRIFSFIVAPIGDTGYVNLYGRDITARKLAEEARQLEHDNLIRILDAMVDGVYIVNQQHDIEYINSVLKREFGPLEGKKCYAYFHDREEICPWCTNQDVFKGKTVRWEWYSFKNQRTYDLVDTPVRNIDGTISKLEIFRNITERKRAEEELQKSREELKNLAAHLQSGREEERTSIAREIHDELGQALTALKMDLFWLRKRLPGDQRPYLKKIQSMVDLTDKTIVTMKRISTDLRPSMLDDLGLVAAMEWQAEEFQNRTGIRCDAAFDFEEIELDEDKRTAIFRIFQETLTNIARHADATRARIYLRKRAKSLELEVRDNGKGIKEEQISDPKAFGLIGIRERVQFVDGNVKISGAPNKGTMVLVKIPLPDIGAVG